MVVGLGSLHLDLGADENLSALLLWAGERGKLGFAQVTLTYHHANVESMLTHHGGRHPVPVVLHLAFYGRLGLPSPYAARVTWACVLPCNELVLVDKCATGGHVVQRMAGDEYDVDVSDDEVRVALGDAIWERWTTIEVFDD